MANFPIKFCLVCLLTLHVDYGNNFDRFWISQHRPLKQSREPLYMVADKYLDYVEPHKQNDFCCTLQEQ